MSNSGNNSQQQQWHVGSARVGKSKSAKNAGRNRDEPVIQPRQGQPTPHHHHQQQPQRGHSHHQNPHPRESSSSSRDRDRDTNHETVCNLLSMLTLGMDQHQQQQDPSSFSGGGSGGASTMDHNRMLLLNMTNSPESCIALRRAGCIPLLIELLHPPSSPPPGIRPPEIIKTRAARALKNIVQFNPDENLKRKELRVLKLLEGIRAYSELVRLALQVLRKEGGQGQGSKPTSEEQKRAQRGTEDSTVVVHEKLRQAQQHPTTNMTSLMKLSFDEEHRNIMCLLGAIHALADLIVCDHLLHGNASPEMKDDCLLIRRYSGMTLTNLTFGDGTNKALLCGMREFMEALVSQLQCDNEEVCQVTASVLRNLSWHADGTSRASLRDSNAVPKLTLAAIKSTKESTLKATLSALWNLSAHSVSNKSAICTASPEALPFLISLLRPNNPILKTLKTPMTIIENAGGILRNISSQICTSPEYRKVLRENHCYEILLEHLKSCSLTVVSNACGTLWNLSGGVGCEEDQRKLLDLNAVPMLKNLIYSKHERISQGAAAALRNLSSSRFAKDHMLHLDSRLAAQIYSPNPGNGSGRENCMDSNQESPGSDGDFEFEFDGNVPQHPQYQPAQQQIIQHAPVVHHHEPPVAHQHSSSAAASIFHRIHSPPVAHSISPAPTHLHQVQNFTHPSNYSSRPSSLNYTVEPEPLDLTLTSAKSSPIHVISAAEFGHHHHQHLHHSQHSQHRKPKSAQAYSHTAQYQSGDTNNQKPFFNSPSLLHQTGSNSQSSSSSTRYNHPAAKFNRSCPEILSRLNSGHGQMNVFVPVPPPAEQTPLDFSSNSPSKSSSLHGAGEARGVHNDSGNGCDTTFNYSLQYTELDEDDRRNAARNGEGTSKSEDTIKTYCYEGTPHNFSISNSCQDLVQEIELEKAAAESSSSEKATNANSVKPQPQVQKLQPIDEAPKSYYVEDTPAVFSRTSSLSSINSSEGPNAGENKAEPLANDSLPTSLEGKKADSLGDDSQNVMPFLHSQPNQLQAHQTKRRSGPQQGTFTPGRVTFSAEETPLMFSRCSSVASLDSLDVGVVGSGGGGPGQASHNDNDDDLSDFSRRASEVVSPSDLPDSPRAMEPPVRVFDQPPTIHNERNNQTEEKQEQEDDIRVFSMEEKSGLNSCRSLSPLMIDGEELPILGRGKLMSDRGQPEQLKTGGRIPAPDISSRDDSKIQGNSEEISNCGLEKKKTSMFPVDEVKTFAMEGTPFYGVSNATSLSDLMMDLDNDDPPKEDVVAVANKPVNLSTPHANMLAKSAGNENGKLEAEAKPIVAPVAEVETAPNTADEPIYSDVQLLQKCIRIGKAAGIPKSKSEYKMSGSQSMEQISSATTHISTSSANLATASSNATGADSKKTLVESKSHDFDDPDLAALIMKGRNRPKEKERPVTKVRKNLESKDKNGHSENETQKSSSESGTSASIDKQSEPKTTHPSTKTATTELKESDEKKELANDPKSEEKSAVDVSTEGSEAKNIPGLKVESYQMDPSQISTTSLGSEWYDETPTFSSPIPSMSISAAFKIVGGIDADDTSADKDKAAEPVASSSPPKAAPRSVASMQSSMLTMSMMNTELLDNVDPPSTFSNVISSSDCVLLGSPQLNPKGSMSDKLSRKWKALNEPSNTSSTHSNLSGQRPPLDLDMENSMISVASIKSEIYEHELSSTASYSNDIFQSASAERLPGMDTSIGGNTYTIFPPEIGDNGKSNDVVSEGDNTVVSDDFTDAEEIEDFETAPADDMPEMVQKAEKSDAEKPEVTEEVKQVVEAVKPKDDVKVNTPPLSSQASPQSKPLMEVHPLETGINKCSTFRVSRSPRASTKQMRRDDPERYKTHSIPGKGLMKQLANDNNGNPLDDCHRRSTFRVGGPKVVKPVPHINSNSPSIKSSRSSSPDSTPGSSPKGLRGRRKQLYSSLPPSAIIKKRVAPPVPPKPARNPSPVRPPSVGSGAGSSVFVRPTRTTELRIERLNSRDSSPGRGGNTSRTGSNSSLNMIHQRNPSRQGSEQEGSVISNGPSRPKIAPKPPVRTSASVSSSEATSPVKPFSGSAYNILIKTSNSSFGFGQQKVAEGSVAQSMKGYSTLPKSSKLGGEFAGVYLPGAVPSSQNGGSKESIPCSAKSQGKIGKLTNLFKKMDLYRHNKEVLHEPSSQLPDNSSKQADVQSGQKKSLKFGNFFGRKKDKSQPQPKPFLDASAGGNNITLASGNTASIRGGPWVKRDGENKAMVAPFNYVPPPGHPNPIPFSGTNNSTNSQPQLNSMVRQSQNHLSNINNANVVVESETQVANSNSSAAAAGSAKITTV